jgi:hypothetical protein
VKRSEVGAARNEKLLLLEARKKLIPYFAFLKKANTQHNSKFRPPAEHSKFEI